MFDAGYYRSLHEPNVELVADDSVERAEGNTVYTKKGRELKADVVILATGFRVRDCKSPSTVYKRWSCSLAWAITPADLFPMKVTNGEGESLQERMDQTGVKTYQGTCVSSFPNFFWILGPNTATNHSSVLFTSEAQLALAFHLIRPVLAALGKGQQQRVKLIKPAPYVEVTRAAEDRYYAELRQRMKGMVWESKGGVAWYVDKATGLCTVSLFSLPLKETQSKSLSASAAGLVPVDASALLAEVRVPVVQRLQVDQLQRTVDVAELPRVVVVFHLGARVDES